MKAFVKANYPESIQADMIHIIDTFSRDLDEKIDNILTILVDRKGKKIMKVVGNDHTSKLYFEEVTPVKEEAPVIKAKKTENPPPKKEEKKTEKNEKKEKKPTLYNCFVKIRVASHKLDPLFDKESTHLSVALIEYRGEMGKYVKANITSKTRENPTISLEENCRLCINDFLDVHAKIEEFIAVNGLVLDQTLTSFKYNGIIYDYGSYLIPSMSQSNFKILLLNEEDKAFIDFDGVDSPIPVVNEENNTIIEDVNNDIEIPVLDIPVPIEKEKSPKETVDIEIPVLDILSFQKQRNASPSSSDDGMPAFFKKSTEQSPINYDDPLLQPEHIPGPDEVESDSEGMDYNN